MKKARETKGYIASIGIDTPDARYEPGDPVPAAVVEESPWLIEQGAVIVKGDEIE